MQQKVYFAHQGNKQQGNVSSHQISDDMHSRYYPQLHQSIYGDTCIVCTLKNLDHTDFVLIFTPPIIF
jgi:hypothetical protein